MRKSKGILNAVGCGAQDLRSMDRLVSPRADVSSPPAFPSAQHSVCSWLPPCTEQEMWGRDSPATRLIDREVKLPYVQHRELMGFCSAGQIARMLFIPEHSACRAQETHSCECTDYRLEVDRRSYNRGNSRVPLLGAWRCQVGWLPQ